MFRKQANLDPAAIDYGYIEYFRKSITTISYSRRTNGYEESLHFIKHHESKRDYYTASLRQVNHLIQIGTPNLELMEPKWELYKVSISFQRIRKFYILMDLGIY